MFVPFEGGWKVFKDNFVAEGERKDFYPSRMPPWQLLKPIANQSPPLTLNTPSYVITLRSFCEEGNVVCDEVEYLGVSKRTGKAIQLKGKDFVRYCPGDQGDGKGKTPCQHLGYLFKNGNTTYYVGDNGFLEVSQGKKTLLSEQGKWDWESDH